MLIITACSWCKKIRDHKGAWIDNPQVLAVAEKAKVCSHGICPKCQIIVARQETVIIRISSRREVIAGEVKE